MNNVTGRKILDLMSHFFPALCGMTGTTLGTLLASMWIPRRFAKGIFLMVPMGLTPSKGPAFSSGSCSPWAPRASLTRPQEVWCSSIRGPSDRVNM